MTANCNCKDNKAFDPFLPPCCGIWADDNQYGWIRGEIGSLHFWAALFPVLSRGLNGPAQDVKQTSWLIVDNMCKIVEIHTYECVEKLAVCNFSQVCGDADAKLEPLVESLTYKRAPLGMEELLDHAWSGRLAAASVTFAKMEVISTIGLSLATLREVCRLCSAVDGDNDAA